jgi:hypothetical protein
MSRQRIKQIMTITILLGVIFVGIGGMLSPPIMRAKHDWVPTIISQWAYHLENVGNFFMIIAPVVLIISDWRNIFPAIKRKRDK